MAYRTRQQGSTVESVGATLPICDSTRRSGTENPTIPISSEDNHSLRHRVHDLSQLTFGFSDLFKSNRRVDGRCSVPWRDSPRCSVGCEPVKQLTVNDRNEIDVDGELASNAFDDPVSHAQLD